MGCVCVAEVFGQTAPPLSSGKVPEGGAELWEIPHPAQRGGHAPYTPPSRTDALPPPHFATLLTHVLTIFNNN